MGPLKSVFGMLGMADLPKDMVEQSEEKLDKYEVIINSMTKAEREDASLLKRAARARNGLPKARELSLTTFAICSPSSRRWRR